MHTKLIFKTWQVYSILTVKTYQIRRLSYNI